MQYLLHLFVGNLIFRMVRRLLIYLLLFVHLVELVLVLVDPRPLILK